MLNRAYIIGGGALFALGVIMLTSLASFWSVANLISALMFGVPFLLAGALLVVIGAVAQARGMK